MRLEVKTRAIRILRTYDITVEVVGIPLASVPGLIAARDIWNSGTLIALMRVLTLDG